MERSMSVKLVNVKTSKYVQQPEGWTEREELAREFGGGTDAIFYCYHHHLTNMRILGQFADPRQNFDITLPDQSFE
jgi:hypothetical protein